MLQAAARIFDRACRAASARYLRFVDGWRRNRAKLIFDIADALRMAFEGRTIELMNLRLWRSLGEPAVRVRFLGRPPETWVVRLTEEGARVEEG